MRIATLFALLLLVTAPALAQDAPAPSTKPATTTAPTAATPIDVVAEKEKLKTLVGQDATVRGKVVEVFVPRSGSVTILNFFDGPARRDFNVVIDKANMDAVNAAFNGDLAAAAKDQTVLVTGTVSEYRGNPQIKVEKPEQIKIEAAKEEKKE